mgnify:FL=1
MWQVTVIKRGWLWLAPESRDEIEMQHRADTVDPDHDLHRGLNGTMAENADTLAEQRAFGQVMAMALLAINFIWFGALGFAYIFAWTR